MDGGSTSLIRSNQSRSSSAVERRFEEPRAGGSTPSFGTMGDEQGLRLALQASRAGSVTPVLHHSGQSRARCTAPPVKRRIGRFDSCDRSQSTRRSSMGRALGLSRLGPEFESPSPHHHPSIAQWTRAPGCGPGGRRFESCWMVHFQGVAQPGSAPGLEPGGRRFESYRPDQFAQPEP